MATNISKGLGMTNKPEMENTLCQDGRRMVRIKDVADVVVGNAPLGQAHTGRDAVLLQ